MIYIQRQSLAASTSAAEDVVIPNTHRITCLTLEEGGIAWWAYGCFIYDNPSGAAAAGLIVALGASALLVKLLRRMSA